jgi:hypothetical protein
MWALHGMAVRILASLGFGAAIALAALLGVAVPGVARAQTLICARHSLGHDDANQLKVAARAVVPKSAHIFIESACVNPGRALRFVETQRIVTAEGVRQWWLFASEFQTTRQIISTSMISPSAFNSGLVPIEQASRRNWSIYMIVT